MKATVRGDALEAARRLDAWIGANGWAGFDPHDVRGTKLFMALLRPLNSVPLKVLRRVAIWPLFKAELFAPRALRRLAGVKPAVNAKGMGLFAQGYLQLFQATGDEAYRHRALECLDWLDRNRSAGYTEPCWGYPFDWQSGVVTPAGTPSSVVTTTVGNAYWAAHRILGDGKYLRTCEGICRFFLKYLKRDEMADGNVCFSYTPIDDFHVHNANLMVADFLCRVGTATGEGDWTDMGLRAGGYALTEQNPDGSLFYWGRVQDHMCPSCIDHYHSGFEIRCLYGIARSTGRPDFRAAADRYYGFYLRHFLEPVRNGEMMPRMTPTSAYPVNIHSCAEAILVAATLADDRPEARERLGPVLRWTVRHMQNPDGSFAYMRRKSLGREMVVDMPYIRWGQGWMMLALSQALLCETD